MRDARRPLSIALFVALLASAPMTTAASPALGARESTAAAPTILANSEGGAAEINERGQVVGHILTPAGARGFLWEGGVLTQLPTLEGSPDPWAVATDVNSAGQVCGYGSAADGSVHPILWQSGHAVDLGTLGASSTGYTFSTAVAINDRGQVVGNSYTASGAPHGYIWQRGKMVDLGTLGAEGVVGTSGDWSQATDINNAGVVVGSAAVYNASLNAVTSAPFTWRDGVINRLSAPDLGAPTRALRITDSGLVFGYGDGTLQGWLEWRNGGEPRVLGHGNVGQLVDAANDGTVLFNSSGPGRGGEYNRVFLWKDGSVTTISNEAELARASGLNNKGAIVGTQLREIGFVPVLWGNP